MTSPRPPGWPGEDAGIIDNPGSSRPGPPDAVHLERPRRLAAGGALPPAVFGARRVHDFLTPVGGGCCGGGSHGADLGGIFFLSPSTGFIATQVGQGTSEDRAQDAPPPSNGGKHWRDVSVINDNCQNVGGLSWGPEPPRRLPQWVLRLRTAGPPTHERRGPQVGLRPPAQRPITAITGTSTRRCSRPHGSAAWLWRYPPCSASPPPPTPAAAGT